MWEILLRASGIVQNLALAAAALVGSYLAWKRLLPATSQADAASTQAELARRSHVTELFNRAVGQLRDEKIEVRLAAVYVLREIGNDFPDLANPVFELLQAYLRERTGDYGDAEPPVDVQVIIETLRMRIGGVDANRD